MSARTDRPCWRYGVYGMQTRSPGTIFQSVSLTLYIPGNLSSVPTETNIGSVPIVISSTSESGLGHKKTSDQLRAGALDHDYRRVDPFLRRDSDVARSLCVTLFKSRSCFRFHFHFTFSPSFPTRGVPGRFSFQERSGGWVKKRC
jgi:hypothetical protein